MALSIPDRVSARAYNNWILGENGCHISTYSTQSRGYAQICWQGDNGIRHGTTAHRAAWTHAHGQVGQGIEVDHRDPPNCDRRCVNVDHLRLLTAAQNKQRQGRKYPLGHCTRGHPDSERRLTSKGMNCRICRRERERDRYWRRKKAAA